METQAAYTTASDDQPIPVRDLRTEKRFFVDNVILRGYGPTLGVYGIAVYTALCMHANLDTQQCYPSHRTIADMLGCCVSKVKEAIRALEELRLIETAPRYDADNQRQTSNLYTILDPPIPPVTTDTPPQYHEKTTMNNPNLEQSCLNQERGANAPRAGGWSWEEPLFVEEEPENPAEKRKAEMRARFGDSLGEMVVHCQKQQEIEGVWTVPVHSGLSPACAVYKEATGYRPAQAVREDIDAAIPDNEEALHNWYKVAHGWILTGYSYKNVAGMLEWYAEGRVGRDKPNGNGRHDRHNGGEPAPVIIQPGEARWLTEEEMAELDRAQDEGRMYEYIASLPGV